MDDPRETARLADAAAAGDAEAVEALLDRHLGDLRAFVRLRAGALIRARESNSDIVQSVCREVLQNMERFQHPSEAAFKQWLFRTALRKLSNRRDFYLAERRDVLRETPIARGGDGSEGGVAESRLFDAYRSFTSPSHRAVVREEIEKVEAAFDQLGEQEREIVTLAHIVGLSRAEIAEQVGKSEGAVRVTLHRALAKIADLVASADEDTEAP
ncbi:MAG: sigma-70 family RNA polymerase sigma factor [Planctomycetota bacterium]